MVLSKFDSLSVRPPTPPKDLQELPSLPVQDATADDFLEDPFGEKPVLPTILAAKTLLNTPEQSPSSDISIPSSCASARKRVNFELQTCVAPSNKAIAQSWTPTRSSPLRPLPQTRVSKPLKSILKPSDGTSTPPPANDAAHKFKTFAEMLESIVKLLASTERSSRLDAYHSLQRTMQAYDNVPDDQALKHKMSLLTQFIRRDMQASSKTGSGLDSQLISTALRLLMALFRITDLIAAMDDDFCSFVVERIISVASDESMPKTVVNTHLAVLMQQSFRPKTMTAARVEKILDVLDTITDRVSGFSVQAYRIRIFKRLVQQRPDVMVKHTERWFKHTLRALMSHQKDIHQSALDATIIAARTVGPDRQVGKSVLSVLNRTRQDGETFASLITQELEKMLGGDNAAMVPQIWSAVTSLLRDLLSAQHFSSFKSWLEVFEKCLRSEKDLVKLHANVSYCVLLYAVNPTSKTADSWTKMLQSIPLSRLQRRAGTKKAEQDAISSAYFTLLYYSLRPDAPFEQLDRYWNEFVVAFWTPLINSAPAHQGPAACRLVSGLINGSRKPWNDHRALELRPQCMTQPSELPLLDPRWVRKSLVSVLQFVELLLESTPWSGSEQSENDPVKTMWSAIMDSLVEASSKEIMASSETKDAIAHIVNLVRRVWDKHTNELAVAQRKEDIWADKFCFLIQTVVQKLGAHQFAEKCLVRNGESDFQVASTPSNRSRQQAIRTSSLLHLIDLVVVQSEGKLSDAIRMRVLDLMIEPCFDAQKTRFNKLEQLYDCASAAQTKNMTTVASHLWTTLASLLSQCIAERQNDPKEQSSRSLGKEYQLVVDIIKMGSAYFLNTTQGHEVLSSFIDIVRQEAGEGAVILAIIEKISQSVLDVVPVEEQVSCLPFASILLRNLPHQMSRRVLEQGRQNLWPSSSAATRSADYDPYHHLYSAVESTGSSAYRNLEAKIVDSIKDFLTALGTSIRQCSISLLAVYMRKMQRVIQTWVEDADGKLQIKGPIMKSLHREVVALWASVNDGIRRLPKKDDQILLHLEPLILAGFQSRRRNILNLSIETWNKTFGELDSLRYPSRLEQALRKLHGAVDLKLPSLDVSMSQTNSDLALYDSDTSIEDFRSPVKSLRHNSPFKISKATRKSKSRSPAVPTPSSRRSSTRQTSKVRLRHDNSQIQFEPVLSSPSNPFNQESQILTERQKEMIERQRQSNGLFANLNGLEPLAEPQSPMEIHSDALTADDLPSEPARGTPLRKLTSMGPMDVFVGSSPTPHARKVTRQIAGRSAETTPTANRTNLLTPDELGSSPPRFDNDKISDLQNKHVSRKMPEQSESPLDAPSAMIDVQLTAQIDADMQAQMEAAEAQDDDDGTIEEPSKLPAIAQQASDTEIEDSQLPSPSAAEGMQMDVDDDKSLTSRVGDSFSSQVQHENGTPKSRLLRRSSRLSMTSSPAPASSSKKKRSETPQGTPRVTRSSQDSSNRLTDESASLPTGGAILDNIVVATPGQRKKKMPNETIEVNSPSLKSESVAELNRKRGRGRPALRSQSLLSQVENSQDEPVERAPTPKRTRRSLGQDVSEAKDTAPVSHLQSQAKRVSHVQDTPRRLTRSSSQGATAATHADDEGETSILEAPVELAQTEDNEENKKIVGQPDSQSTNMSTPARSFTERVILTPRSIINHLKSLKDFLFSAPQFVLGREEEIELDNALYNLRNEVHDAGKRGWRKSPE